MRAMESAHGPRSSGTRSWAAAVLAVIVLGAPVARSQASPLDGGTPVDAAVDVPGLAPAPAAVVPVPPPGSPASPTLTPDLPVVAAPALDQPAPAGPVRQGKPFYRKDWFWGAIGVMVLTAAIVLVATSGSSADAPTTTLGNMRAF
jgi:hypothetical protein